MMPYTRFGQVCDFIGTGALVGAAAALGSLLTLNVAESSAFSVLFTSLAVAVGAFGVARFVEIVRVLASHQDPRRRRVAQVPLPDLAAVPTAVKASQDSDLPRAA